MIEKLNVFSAGTFVNCNDWNANFRTLNNYANYCTTYIGDAEQSIATETDDMTYIFSAIKTFRNSTPVVNNVISRVEPENEYYTTLLRSTDHLVINVPKGINACARFIFKINNRYELSDAPFIISYDGETTINVGELQSYESGTYMLFLYESKNQCIIKLMMTGE